MDNESQLEEKENEESDPGSIGAGFEMLASIIEYVLDFFNVKNKK